MYATLNIARTEKLSTHDIWVICRKKILPKALSTFLFYLAIGVFTTYSEADISLELSLVILFVMTTLTTVGWSFYDLVAIVSLKKESYLLNSLKLPEAYSEVVLPDSTFKSLQAGKYLELSFCPSNACLLQARALTPDEVRSWNYTADKPQDEPMSFNRFFMLSVGRSMLVAGIAALLLHGLISIMLTVSTANNAASDNESLLALIIQQVITASSIGGAIGAVLALFFSVSESYQLNPHKVAWQVALASTICLALINGAIP